MNNNYTVRFADLGDIDEIHKLVKLCFRHYQKAINFDGKLSAITETISDIEYDILNNKVYICLLDKEIIGTARITINDNKAELTRVGVDPYYQSKGVGGCLLKRIISDCRNLGLKSISLHTASGVGSSIEFYKKHDFAVVSKSYDRGYSRALLTLNL